MTLCVSCFRNLETLRREALLKCNGITPLFQCPGMCFYTDPAVPSSRRRTPLPNWEVVSSDTFPNIPPSPRAKRTTSLNLRQHLGAFSRQPETVGDTKKAEWRSEEVVMQLKAGLQWFFLQQFTRGSEVPNITEPCEDLE